MNPFFSNLIVIACVANAYNVSSAYLCLMTVVPPANLTWLPVDLRQGPCSASLDAAAAPPSLTDLLHRDELRAADVQKRLSGNGTDDKAPAAGGGDQTNVYSGSKVVVRVGSRPPTKSSSTASTFACFIPVDYTTRIELFNIYNKVPGGFFSISAEH
jgi:hypothetical protein